MEGLLQTLLAEGHPALNGTIEAEIYEKAGKTPTRVIRSDQAWEVRVEWKMCGDFVPVLNDDNIWHLHINLESMGKGIEDTYFVDEKRYGDHIVTPDGCYKWVLSKVFDEKELEPIPHEGALFRVFATLTYRQESGIPGPFAGFVELPPVQIFNVPEIKP